MPTTTRKHTDAALLVTALCSCAGNAATQPDAHSTGDPPRMDGGVTADVARPSVDAAADGGDGQADAHTQERTPPEDARTARDAVDRADREVYPASHPPLPVVANMGGPVLTHPRVVPIFYQGDPLENTLVQFLTSLAGSSYWAQTTAEYGVGALTIAPPIILSAAPPATVDDSELAAWIAMNVSETQPDGGGALDAGAEGGGADGGAAWPAPDGNTMYTFFFPASTVVTSFGGVSCTAFLGYHFEASYAGGRTPYVVIPRCADDELTLIASHEFAEASTDPFPSSAPAYSATTFPGSGWGTLGGGEVGDLCVFDPSSEITPPDIGFPVQRIWSNAVAARGGDPCAPAAEAEVYFNSVPDLSNVQLTPEYYVDGVLVKPGASTRVAVHLFGEAATPGPWAVAAEEVQFSMLPPDPENQLSFSFDKAQGQNGDVLYLTITRAPLPDGVSLAGLPFQITSTLGSESHVYFGIAGF